MALLKVRIPRKIAWALTDTLELWLGTEDAASLAASSPAGGVKVAETPAWGSGDVRGGFGLDPVGGAGFGFTGVGYGFGLGEFGFGEFGLHDAPRALIEHSYRATLKCSTLPLGVKVRDLAGNRSAVSEKVAQIADPPRGARNLDVASTGSPLQALLTWDASPDL